MTLIARKKPIEVKAEQFTLGNPWPYGVSIVDGDYSIFDNEQHCFVTVNPGDWIITGINGERYPCSDEVFKQTYDIIGPASPQNDI